MRYALENILAGVLAFLLAIFALGTVVAVVSVVLGSGEPPHGREAACLSRGGTAVYDRLMRFDGCRINKH